MIFSSRADTVPKKTGKTPNMQKQLPNKPIFRFYKYPESMLCVIYNEESKTGLGFEIGHRQQNAGVCPVSN